MRKERNKHYEYTFTVTVAGKEEKLDKNSPVENCTIHAIKTRRRPASGGKSLNGDQIVPNMIFDSGFLTIKKGQTEVVDQTPLAHIEQASLQFPEWGYPVEIDGIDWAQSTLRLEDLTGLTAGDVVEFTVIFSKR